MHQTGVVKGTFRVGELKRKHSGIGRDGGMHTSDVGEKICTLQFLPIWGYVYFFSRWRIYSRDMFITTVGDVRTGREDVCRERALGKMFLCMMAVL
jgi:hypothetical protein